MEMSFLGNTGLKISRLGIGLAEIGYQLTSENILEASNLLNTAIDNGINFLDTSYLSILNISSKIRLNICLIHAMVININF